MGLRNSGKHIIKYSAAWLGFTLPLLAYLIFFTPTVAAVVISDSFNYPVGPRTSGSVTEASDGDGWYNAQDFGEFNSSYGGLHPAEDWNDERGGNSDIGAPVYAASHGKVVVVRDLGNIGEVLALEHSLPDGTTVYSVYVHIDVASNLQIGSEVSKDYQVGTIADISSANLPSHLHFELRTKGINPQGPLWPNSLGNGYYASQAALLADGFTVDPSDFIDARRTLAVAAPTNFTGVGVSPTRIDLSWNDTKYEANFDVWRYRWQGTGWEFVTTLPANTTAYNDTGLLSDSYYYYAIRAYAGNISSGWVYFGWVSTPAAPVAAPSNFTGMAVSTTQINLFWQDNATNEQNYELWRYRWQGFGWESVATLPANTTAYGNTGVLSNSYYYYAIRANGTTTASEWVYFGWIKTP